VRVQSPGKPSVEGQSGHDAKEAPAADDQSLQLLDKRYIEVTPVVQGPALWRTAMLIARLYGTSAPSHSTGRKS